MKVRAALFLGSLLVCIVLPPLSAQAKVAHAKIALFGLAHRQGDYTVSAAAKTVADTIELTLWLLGRYDVDRLPPADPTSDLARIREYCRVNRVDQAICGGAQAKGKGGFSLRLAVYDRMLDNVSVVRDATAASALGIFEVTDALVSSLLDGLNGSHVELGMLEVQSDPADAAIFMNGREVGRTPLTLRSVPAGFVQVVARADGREEAAASAEVTDGGVARAALTLARSTGALRLEIPDDATLSIRDADGGERRASGPGVVADIPTGTCEVQAQCAGLAATRAFITVARNETVLCMPWPKGYLVVESDPPGAAVSVDGMETGVSPLVTEIEPGRHHSIVLRLANHEAYTVEADATAGRKGAVRGVLVPFPGSIRVETNFPGAHVALDWERTLESPCVFEDVAPGEHHVHVFPVLVNKRYYRCDNAEAVQVSAGKPTVVSKTLTQDRATLTILDAPPGSTLFLDGTPIDAGAALAEGIQVPAGFLDVELRAPRGQSWKKSIVLTSHLNSGSNGVLTLGTGQMALQMMHRTIKIDGKIDDWEDLEPVMQRTRFATDLCPNQPGTLMSRGFVCRDEKFLYIRYDFADGSPSEKLSDDVPYRLDYGPHIRLSPHEEIVIGICTNRTLWGSQQTRYFGFNISGTKSFHDLGGGLEAKAGDAALEIAVPLEPIRRIVGNQAPDIRLFVARTKSDGNWQTWVESTAQVINFAN